MALAFVHVERNAADDRRRTEALADVAQFQREWRSFARRCFGLHVHRRCAAVFTAPASSVARFHAAATIGQVLRNTKKPPASNAMATIHGHGLAACTVIQTIRIRGPNYGSVDTGP